MLISDFYKITSLEENNPGNIKATILLNKDHSVYAAHFPGNPITPGVIEIQLVKEMLEHHLNKELKLATMARCKFLKILNPVETPEVNIIISYTLSEEKIKINASIEEQENIYLKISAVYL